MGIAYMERMMQNPSTRLSPTAIYINVLVMILILFLKGSVAAALGLMWRRVRSGVLVLNGARGQAMPMVDNRP